MGYETKMFIVTSNSDVNMTGSKFINNIETNEPNYVFKGDNQNYFIYNIDKTQKELSKDDEKQIFTAHVTSTIAMVDLCKCGGLVSSLISNGHHDPLKERTNSRGIMWDTFDGNKYISVDQYGDPMYLIPSKEVLEVLKKEQEIRPYRRYDMAIKLLESTIFHFDLANHPTYVMFFGY